MKVKFAVFSFFLIFFRGCDFYSTSLWFFDNPADETNPMSMIFGMGWTGFIIFNIVVVSFILYLFYYYSFQYSVNPISELPNKLTEYISKRYYGVTKKFYWIFYKIPKNKSAFFGHLGYTIIRVVIIASILATIHNLCQFYHIPIYNTFREIVNRPLYFIYGLIIISTIYFLYRIWSKEFKEAKENWIIDNRKNAPQHRI